MSRPAVPPGWPAQVPPPGVPDWESSAAGWLLDLCPPELRRYEVLRRHPVVLARFAALHSAAGERAAREGLATCRAELRDLVPPEVVAAAVGAWEREGVRLVEQVRAVDLVEQALRGRRYVARL